jgi:hypothetical protein
MANERRELIAHFVLTRAEVESAWSNGRSFASATGERLDSLDSIRATMKRDGEVWSRQTPNPRTQERREG